MKTRLGKSIPYILLGGSLLLVIGLNLFCHDHWLDSDMAAEMMFSKLLSDEGRFFATPDWYYSTEFRFLYTHWIIGPLFRVLKDWHVIRMITNVVSYVLMLGAYFFFMKPLQVKKELVVGTSALLLLPFSETMMTHMVMGNTYLFHIIIVFLFFGLYLRLGGVKEGNRLVWLTGFLSLAVICGVSGVRYLLALQCPLALTGMLGVLRSVEFQELRTQLTPKNGKSLGKNLAKDLLGSISVKYLGFALLGVVASLIGYGINVLYVSRQYVFQTYDATNFIAVYQGVLMERIQNAFGSLLMLFGYIPNRGVLSLRGVISLIAFLLLFVFGYVAVQAGRDSKGQRRFVTDFLYSTLALNLFVFVFTTSTMVPRYYLTIFIFLLPVLCFYLEKEEKFFDRMAVILVLTVCMGMATGKTVMSYLSVDKNADRRVVARYLSEQDFTFGYATYWNANIITELTDGQVEVANVCDGVHLDFFRWSSPMKYYQEGYSEGEVFLLLTDEELTEAIDSRVISEGTVVYAENGYNVLVYESAQELFGLVEE